MKKLILTIISTLLLAPAALATTGEFQIHPTYKHQDNSAWIINTIQTGTTTKDYITIENLTNKTITLNLITKDAKEIDNKFTIKDNEPNKELGSWIKLPKTKYILAPHQKQKIPITIQIPKTAKEKTYKASILASKTTQQDSINIVTRIGIRTYITTTKNETQANILTNNNYEQTTLLLISLIGFITALILNLKPQQK